MDIQIDAVPIERLRRDFAEQWRGGGRPTIEATMERYQGSHRRLMLTTLMSMEIHLRHELGENLSVEEFAGRFPGLEAYVRLAFGLRSVPHLFPSEWVKWFMRPRANASSASE